MYLISYYIITKWKNNVTYQVEHYNINQKYIIAKKPTKCLDNITREQIFVKDLGWLLTTIQI